MEFEEMTAVNLRIAARHFVPESRGVSGISHSGTKEQIIELLRSKGIMACEVAEYLAGNASLTAPKEVETAPLFPAQSQESVKDHGDTDKSITESITEGNDDCNGDELEIIRRIITKKVKKEASVNVAEVAKIVDEKLSAFEDNIRSEIRKNTVRVIEVKQVELPNRVIGVCHKLTEQISLVANLGIHQMLVGPAGSGKTTCCENVAEILNLKFFLMSVGPQTTKSDLLGFIDAAGNYHTTPIREAFEHGGLLLLDEMDAANAGVLTVINSLLSNGYCSFPDGIKQRNENFRCICACNTFGRGADRQYVGRNQLDAATLDRFAVVDFDYDEELEKELAGNIAWVEKVQRYRKRAFDLHERVVISPRASISGAKLIASGMSEKKVEELVIWKGISKDIRRKIQAF